MGDVAYGGNWFFLIPWGPIGPRLDEYRDATLMINGPFGSGRPRRWGRAVDHVICLSPARQTPTPRAT
jgi:hypothetical protein